MSFISNTIKPLAIAALLSASHSFAADILVENTLIDNNGVNDAIGGWKYEVNHMDVTWIDDGNISVDVYTNFGDYNNRYSYGGNGNNIVFGDLLISTGGDTNVFDYAFKLTDGRFDDYYGSGYSEHNGNLVEISSTTTADQYHGGNVQHDGQVFGNQSSVESSGTWSVDTHSAGQNYDNYDIISFNFNVDGVAAFQSASQLAFSWAMSCANDVIHDVVSVNRPSTIPEPATMMLFLLGLAVIARNKAKLS
ncbi:MAG: PEP-CTERM sorting domain-containing protein [Colwellia sp.]|nr:PEP-CTERM sorting domain-containing protein [Colwellia sp.]MCW8865705.1 PEP-CTERM sorting domain-containing protein [Colwellia sp.]MCW9080227.1 PEP-CTERM sorting domain-containing protein [Colwellia sp.]